MVSLSIMILKKSNYQPPSIFFSSIFATKSIKCCLDNLVAKTDEIHFLNQSRQKSVQNEFQVLISTSPLKKTS